MKQLEFGDLNDTLREEQKRIEREREKGTHCQACGQFAKVYPRQIHSTMAVTLIDFYKLSKQDEGFHHVAVIFTKSRTAMHRLNGGDWAKLAGWGLIEEQPKDASEKTKRTSGFWRITEAGKNFVEKRTKVPRYMYVYDDKILGFSEAEVVGILDCLKEKFNYEELMNS